MRGGEDVPIETAGTIVKALKSSSNSGELSIKVYYPNFSRENAVGCETFSFRDCRKFLKLDEEGRKAFFELLDKAKSEKHKGFCFYGFKAKHLSPIFLAGWQSLRLYNFINREIKPGVSLENYMKKYWIKITPQVIQNHLITYKIDKYMRRIIDTLNEKGVENCEKQANKFFCSVS